MRISRKNNSRNSVKSRKALKLRKAIKSRKAMKLRKATMRRILRGGYRGENLIDALINAYTIKYDYSRKKHTISKERSKIHKNVKISKLDMLFIILVLYLNFVAINRNTLTDDENIAIANSMFSLLWLLNSNDDDDDEKIKPIRHNITVYMKKYNLAIEFVFSRYKFSDLKYEEKNMDDGYNLCINEDSDTGVENDDYNIEYDNNDTILNIKKQDRDFLKTLETIDHKQCAEIYYNKLTLFRLRGGGGDNEKRFCSRILLIKHLFTTFQHECHSDLAR
jgi:hypothetical protein